MESSHSQANRQDSPPEDSPTRYKSGTVVVDNTDRNEQRNKATPVAWEDVHSVLDSARKSMSSSGPSKPPLPEEVERRKEQVTRMINDLAEQQKTLIIQRMDLKAKLDAAHERTNRWKAEHDRIKKEFKELQAAIGAESVEAAEPSEEISEGQHAAVHECPGDEQQDSQPDIEQENKQHEQQGYQEGNKEEQQVQEVRRDKGKQLASEPEPDENVSSPNKP